jgi:hypothetical protein
MDQGGVGQQVLHFDVAAVFGQQMPPHVANDGPAKSAGGFRLLHDQIVELESGKRERKKRAEKEKKEENTGENTPQKKISILDCVLWASGQVGKWASGQVGMCVCMCVCMCVHVCVQVGVFLLTISCRSPAMPW